MPDFPALKADSNSSTLFPLGETTPRPVMTTLCLLDNVLFLNYNFRLQTITMAKVFAKLID